MKLGKGIAELCQSRQGVFRLSKQARGAVGFVSAIQTFHSGLHAVTQLFRVLQHLAALLEKLILSGLQVRLFNLCDLVFQGLHAAQLFTLVHGQGVNLPPQFRNGLIFFAVILPQRGIIRKAVEKGQMVFFVKQSGRIMLAVNVNELNAQLMENGHIDQGAVDPADVLSVQMDLPGDYRFRIIVHAIFRKPL